MKVPQEWVWENDPAECLDDDHARCIAAPGERLLACGGQLFALTTRPCTFRSGPSDGRGAAAFATLQMEYLGLDWERGLAQRHWGGERFPSASPGGAARQAAGLALLATVAGAMAAGATQRRSPSSPSQPEDDDRRPPPRPPGRPPAGHAPRRPWPAMLPLTVGRGGDPR